MTTIPFTPANTVPPFSCQLTLDGSAYTFIAVWSIFRNDWYYALYNANGGLVEFQPLIGSPPATEGTIYLAPGLFTTSTLAYRVSTGSLEQNP